MSRLRYLNPLRIRDAVRDIRRISSGGGPRKLRLVEVGEPEGLLVPTARIVLEVESKDGQVVRFEPQLPVPWPYAWTYRVARRLGVPLVRDYDPKKPSFELSLPRRGRASAH